MIKLMIIQRNNNITHQVLNVDTTFHDFHELVTFENFGRTLIKLKHHNMVHLPHNKTTYTLLTINDVEEI